MKNKNLYVDIHVLQNVPPSCVNRDDTGSPKTAKYGGVTRARVSSQSWKHEMRKMFGEIFDEENVGIRTRRVGHMVAKEIQKIDESISDKKALKLAVDILKNAGINSDKDGKSKVLIFFSLKQARALAELAVNGENDKTACKNALNINPSVDMVLFGRMVAADASLNYDAAAQVAHAISTHSICNEHDYFVAVDDLDEKGAGHLDIADFNSSTLYRYATVNALELKGSLGKFTVDAIKGFVEAFIKTMPTGKQNTFANRTFPDYVYITFRTDQPVNLCGAFERPVTAKEGGYLNSSVKVLEEYSEDIYSKYECSPKKEWVLSKDMPLSTIICELEETLNSELSDGGEE